GGAKGAVELERALEIGLDAARRGEPRAGIGKLRLFGSAGDAPGAVAQLRKQHSDVLALAPAAVVAHGHDAGPVAGEGPESGALRVVGADLGKHGHPGFLGDVFGVLIVEGAGADIATDAGGVEIVEAVEGVLVAFLGPADQVRLDLAEGTDGEHARALDVL